MSNLQASRGSGDARSSEGTRASGESRGSNRIFELEQGVDLGGAGVGA